MGRCQGDCWPGNQVEKGAFTDSPLAHQGSHGTSLRESPPRHARCHTASLVAGSASRLTGSDSPQRLAGVVVPPQSRVTYAAPGGLRVGSVRLRTPAGLGQPALETWSVLRPPLRLRSTVKPWRRKERVLSLFRLLYQNNHGLSG